MDRVILGKHANTLLNEVGLYVSKPGANVLDPQTYLNGNLMFSSTDASSLNVIQSGAFKITCEREAVSTTGTTAFRGNPSGEKVFQLKLTDIFGSGDSSTPRHHVPFSHQEYNRKRFIWATHYRAVGTSEELDAAVSFGLTKGIIIPKDTWADNRDMAQKELRETNPDLDTYGYRFYMDVAGKVSNANKNNVHMPGAGWCFLTPGIDPRADLPGSSGTNPSGISWTDGFGATRWLWDGDVVNNQFDGFFPLSAQHHGGHTGTTDLIVQSVVPNSGVKLPVHPITGADPDDQVVPSDLHPGAMLRLVYTRQFNTLGGGSHADTDYSVDPYDRLLHTFDDFSFMRGPSNWNRAPEMLMAIMARATFPFFIVTVDGGGTAPNQYAMNPLNANYPGGFFDDGSDPMGGYFFNEAYSDNPYGTGVPQDNTDPKLWDKIQSPQDSESVSGQVSKTPNGRAWIAPSDSAPNNPNQRLQGFGATAKESILLGEPSEVLFYHDSERPTRLDPSGFGTWIKTGRDDMEGNFLDRGNITIPIINPLPNGEIAEVAIRFAVGSSGKDGKPVRFHPWYAKGTAAHAAGGWAPDWDDFTYTNEDEIVHMDSPWTRFKWGGIGNELYSGSADLEKSRAYFLQFYSESTLALYEGFGIDIPGVTLPGTVESRLLADSALGHLTGASGLFQFSNSTHLSVEAHMTPTHTGTRKPFAKNYFDEAGRSNAIEDYANINFPLYSTPGGVPSGTAPGGSPNSLNPAVWRSAGYVLFDNLPETVGDEQNLFNQRAQVSGSGSIYGYVGHPTQYFFNPFSNSMCTFHTNLFPPFLDKYDPGTYPLHYYGRFEPFEYDNVRRGGLSHVTNPGDVSHPTLWGPAVSPAITSQAESDSYWNYTHASQTGDPRVATIQWPPGHEFASWQDVAEWTGSMGMGGAGPAGTLGLSPGDSNCWDTYYCSYVIYSHGSKPSVSAQQSNTITVSARSSIFAGGNMINASKYRADADDDDIRYFNLNFPDDFVGTPGDPLTDPFHSHRDEFGKIYGSLNIIFEIPEYDDPGGLDPLHIGSEDFEKFWTQTGPGLADKKYTGKPKPAITFDLSGRNFNFINNQNLNLIIKNHGIVLGGGGAGGYGGHYNYDLNPGDVVPGGKTLPGDAPLKIGGGGGGAGGGSGRAHAASGTLLPSDTSWAGPGKAGSGYGRALNIVGSIDHPWMDGEQGETGTDMTLHTSASGSYRNVSGGAGGAAGTVETINRLDSVQPDYGSDGGDCFFIVHDETYLPNIEIINIGSESNSTQTTDAMIRSGGGGAGGGAGGEIIENGQTGRTSAKVFGATGAEAGYNGNPDTSVTGANNRYQWPGGNAGYLVGAYADNPFDDVDVIYNVGWPEIDPNTVTAYPEDTEDGVYEKLRAAYAGKVTVRNESSTETIYARHPTDAPVPGAAGWSLAVGNLEYN